jgi:hypothetical protein
VRRPHELELERDIAFKQPVLLRPATEPPQCFKPTVDGGRFQCVDVDEVLAVVDQVKDQQLLETPRRAFGLAEPAQELLQIVTVATHSGRREIIAPQTAHESASQRSDDFRSTGCVVRNVVPRVRPPDYCVKPG